MGGSFDPPDPPSPPSVQAWEYIALLREKFYGAQPPGQKTAPAIGEIVLVVNDGPRSNWPLGRIVELLPDNARTVRLVSVMVGGRVVLKTLGKIIPIEIGLPVEELTETETDMKYRP